MKIIFSTAALIGMIYFAFVIITFLVSFFKGLRRIRKQNRVTYLKGLYKWHSN